MTIRPIIIPRPLHPSPITTNQPTNLAPIKPTNLTVPPGTNTMTTITMIGANTNMSGTPAAAAASSSASSPSLASWPSLF